MPPAPPDAVHARLGDVLRELVPGAAGRMSSEARLVEDLGLDSLGLARAVVALEDAFGVELPADRLHELRSATVSDLAALLSESGARA